MESLARYASMSSIVASTSTVICSLTALGMVFSNVGSLAVDFPCVGPAGLPGLSGGGGPVTDGFQASHPVGDCCELSVNTLVDLADGLWSTFQRVGNKA